MFQVLEGDCLEVLKTMPDCSVDAIVTDPPAGIAFMGKDWDKDKGGRDHWIKWMSEVAAECCRIIKPGGHALVWALPRTSHWTGMAWENGGWEPRDKFVHLFGTGFPKSLDISKQIDKLHGAERRVVGKNQYAARRPTPQLKDGVFSSKGPNFGGPESCQITAPATPDAEKWDGFGTALKPAHEDWWLFRKPLEGTVAENVLKHGTGGLNIGACRIGTEKRENPAFGVEGWRKLEVRNDIQDAHSKVVTGRWPANVVLTCSCEGDHSESCPVSQFPDVKGGSVKPYVNKSQTSRCVASFSGLNGKPRFYKREAEPLSSAARFFYTAKASKRDRDEGLENLPKTVTDDGRNKSIDNPYQRGETLRHNPHPTVKATPLMRWLCRLICPPGAVILDPFCGSGSTGKAAVLEGFEFIGIEQDPESVQVARARIAWAAEETETAPSSGAELRPPYDDPVVKPTKILSERPKQLSLFGV